MTRRYRYLIGLLAAALTFGTFTAVIGTDHWERGHYWGRDYHGYYHDHCFDPQAEPTPDEGDGI